MANNKSSKANSIKSLLKFLGLRSGFHQ